MATWNGNNARVEAGGNAVGKLKTVTLDKEVETQEDEYLGVDGVDVTVGSTKYTSSITYHDDPDDAGQAALVLGEEISVTLYPAGNITGKKQTTYTAIPTADPMTLEKNSKVEKTVPLKVVGVPTEVTIS